MSRFAHSPLRYLVVLLALALSASGCAFGGKMSADDVAAFLQRTAPTMLNVSCSDVDTNGWDYACSYTDSHNGAQMRMGVRAFKKTFTGSGSVPVDQPLPPPTS